MSKRFFKVFAVAIILSICCAVFAALNVTALADTGSQTAMDIIREQLLEEEREILLNKDYYNDYFYDDVGKKLEEFEFEDAPILKVYTTYNWSDCGKNIEKIVEEFERDNFFNYLVFWK